MSKKAIIAACSLLLALASCSPAAKQQGIDIVQDVGAGMTRNISVDQLVQIRQQCLIAAPGILAAAADTAPPKVRDVAIYAKAFCEQMMSDKAYVDPTQNSVSWLTKVLQDTAIAAHIAGYAIPVLLPLL